MLSYRTRKKTFDRKRKTMQDRLYRHLMTIRTGESRGANLVHRKDSTKEDSQQNRREDSSTE